MSQLTIGELVRRRRFDLDLNQQEAADQLGLNQSSLSKWERGGRIDASRLPKLAEWLQMPLGELMNIYHGSSQSLEAKVDMILELVQQINDKLDAYSGTGGGSLPPVSRPRQLRVAAAQPRR